MAAIDPRDLAQEGALEALPDLDAEVERLLIADAVIERRGDHYRIVSGEESWDELSQVALRAGGVCPCGTPLCNTDGRPYCRLCDL